MIKDIQQLIADPKAYFVEEVQALWSDFGSLERYFSPKRGSNVVVKKIAPPSPESSTHPRGWNTSTSHARKLKSYFIESEFYQNFAQYTDHNCSVPQLIAADIQDDRTLLIMDDLAALGFSETREHGSEFLAKQVIHWLAHFHAKFMHVDANKLWPQGGYWHIATRQDELKKMPESELKSFAATIDHKLKQAKFQTLVHGDAKLQNMCFHPEFATVAAVDFQYVGKAAGVVDLMYFLGSAFKQEDLYKYNDSLLEFYLTTLESALKQYKVELNFSELKLEYCELYKFAWADFNRFLQGWNPNSWKVNDFIVEMTNIAIQSIKDQVR